MILIFRRKYRTLTFTALIIFSITIYGLFLSHKSSLNINSQEIPSANLIDAVKYVLKLNDSLTPSSEITTIVKLTKSIEKKRTTRQPSDAGDDNGKRMVFKFYGQDGYTANVRTKCGSNVDLVPSSNANDADILYYLMSAPERRFLKEQDNKRKYMLVYAMESEPHSGGGNTWKEADFRMWYNLDLSFPEPATYFDVRSFLVGMIAPPVVDFDAKNKEANLVWVLSNCHAFNARQVYVKNLMSYTKVDSYGGCLRNKNGHPSEHMRGNVELFSKYKFVIAIENSNCQDYVTEKLVHAVASGSIPIVAGKDDKPDYLKFMPKNSYINIYDFKSPQELAKHIELVASKREEYQKYIQFKFNHNYTREYLNKLTLEEIIKVSKTVIDPAEKFFSELVLKEKSENKLCKVARYLSQTPADVVESEIAARKENRPSIDLACLPNSNLANDFKS